MGNRKVAMKQDTKRLECIMYTQQLVFPEGLGEADDRARARGGDREGGGVGWRWRSSRANESMVEISVGEVRTEEPLRMKWRLKAGLRKVPREAQVRLAVEKCRKKLKLCSLEAHFIR